MAALSSEKVDLHIMKESPDTGYRISSSIIPDTGYRHRFIAEPYPCFDGSGSPRFCWRWLRLLRQIQKVQSTTITPAPVKKGASPVPQHGFSVYILTQQDFFS